MSDLAPIRVSRGTERFGVTAAYAAQGLSYAAVVTALPVFKDRYDIDDDTVALITLTVVLTAAAGSWLADLVAIRWGSRVALVLGLGLQALALATVALPVPFVALCLAFAVYGTGLGAVDASGAMQGVLAQRRIGRQVMGSFFAAGTAAGIVGALFASGGAFIHLGSGPALALAAALAAAVAIAGTRIFDPSMERAAQAPKGERPPLPTAGIWIFGFVVFAAFTLDSTVSTWSTVYLEDDLAAPASLAPLGYACYAGATLITRLASDLIVRRWGRARLAAVTSVLAVVGVAGIGAAGFAGAPGTVLALGGLALAGLGVGALVPLAFSAAGDLDPRRGDEVVARVNLFNYAGSLLGAVLPGLLSGMIGLDTAFLIAAVLAAPVIVTAKRFRAASA